MNKRYQGEFSETFLSRYLWRIEELSQWAAPLWELYHRTSKTTQHLRGHAPLRGQKLRESLPCSCTPGGGDATPTSRLNGFVGWTCGWGWNIKSDSYFLLQIILCYKLLPFVWQNKNIFSTQYVCNLLMQAMILAFVNEIHMKTWFSEIKWSQLSYVISETESNCEIGTQNSDIHMHSNIRTTINTRFVSNIQQIKSHITASQQKINTQMVLNIQERILKRKNKISNIQL